MKIINISKTALMFKRKTATKTGHKNKYKSCKTIGYEGYAFKETAQSKQIYKTIGKAI